jgi:hypothetical protein
MTDLNTPQRQDNTDAHGEKSQDGSTLSNITLSEAEGPSPPPKKRHCYHCHCEPKPWWKRINWQLLVELVVFGLGFKVACIYEHQLKAMLEANELTRNNFVVDERAWVGIDFKLVHTVNPDGTVRFIANGELRNTGKTPALKMSLPHAVVITKPWDELIDQDKEWESGISSVRHSEETGKQVLESEANKKVGHPELMAMFAAMLANQSEKWHSQGGALAPNAPPLAAFAVDETLVDPSARNGKPQVTYWLGRLTYSDIFSKPHTTKFCLWYAEHTFELCPTGNSMD